MFPFLSLKGSLIAVPSMPFLWYREMETILPIEFITMVPETKLRKIIGSDYMKNINLGECFISLQKNIANENIYVCNHGYVFHKENPALTEINEHFFKNFP